ncbi:corticotropin-releasing factor receptor 1-like isoform X2 [Eriocheir sinensis]|uniref:corticotropin-releasing factor receptor 1-like isoform X2 n=1 Tax=Eriocheir sinensis TaxID=95602 RepID=UPI0021C7EE5C|nr:corticotropin-releasing factor receptor 1-like isoform X2 [Eriocheir sinensis]XP_050693288.1 corticotropin-releasing factor receptor 1-like isoform X2 [Eriocheir sinensis]
MSGLPPLASHTPTPAPRLLPSPSPSERRCLQDSQLTLPSSAGVFCPPAWDSLHCWPATRAGQAVSRSCAQILKDVPLLHDHPDAQAFRECGSSGEWLWSGWTNYSQCLTVIEKAGTSGVAEAVGYITFVGALLSLLTLLITVVIFSCFWSLECDRLRVHRNLVAALILRFLVMLVLTEPFVSHRQTRTYRDVDWLCKSLLGLRMYAQMASVSWMFVEGLFLHSRLTSNVFDSRAPFGLYYTIGWGCPLVFLAAWSSVMAVQHPTRCWRGYGDLPLVWILVAPMVAALGVNLLFLVNIVRILVTKLRASDAQVRTAVKATLVLFPLLGTTNLLFAVNPADSGGLEGAYMLANALLQSSQGVFVSVLYCFLNGEVQEAVRQRWRQYRTRWLGVPPSRRRETRSSGDFEASCSFTSNAKTLSTVQAYIHSPDLPCPRQPAASSASLHSVLTPPTSRCGTAPHTPYLRQLCLRVLRAEAIPLECVRPPPAPHPPRSAPRGHSQHMTSIA